MLENVPVGAEKLFSVENDFASSPLADNEGDIATALISTEAAQQNLQVKRYKKLVYDILDSNRRVTFLQNSPQNSAVYSYCAKQKHIAKEIMARQGVPVPEGDVFSDREEAWSFIEAADIAMVLKPVDRAYGTGISTNIRSREDFLKAWEYAAGYSREILVERCVSGYDLRVVVVGGTAVAACARIPANVVGDGASSIKELVERKNAERQKNPSLRLDLIKRFDLLERTGRSLEDVAAPGERVQLTSVANVSAGGDAVQLIDLVHPDVLRVAERAACCFPGLMQVGVDLMVDDRSPEVRAEVIEVNSNPGISDAVFPSYGRPVNVPEVLLKYVFDNSQDQTAASGDHKMAPAVPYSFAPNLRVAPRGESEQAGLLTQAAYAAGLTVEQISPYVFRVSDNSDSVMFYQGMPDRTNVIARKVSRDRKWLQELLVEAGVQDASAADTTLDLCQYRLIVINGCVVAGVDGGPYAGEKGGTARYAERRRDVTDMIHPGFVKVLTAAVEAAFNPYLAGVDLIAEDIERSPGQQAWKVADIMCNPNFTIHHFPSEGVGRDVAASLLSSLFPEVFPEKPPMRCVYAVVSGRVQGVGYRDWIQRQAVRYGVAGWVRNLSHGDVEMFFEGPASGVDSVLALARQGPARARVSALSVDEHIRAHPRAFLVYR